MRSGARAQSAAKAWTRDPGDPQAVHTSGNLVVRPCGARNVIDLSVLDGTRATVLCANGDVRASTDGGQRWPLAFTAKRALALTVAEGGAGMLIQTDPTCAGVLAVPLVSGKPAKGGQCVTGPTTDGSDLGVERPEGVLAARGRHGSTRPRTRSGPGRAPGATSRA